MSILDTTEEKNDMAGSKPKQPRSMQISIDGNKQFLFNLFCSTYGMKTSTFVRMLMQPYISYMVKMLQEDGYMDEFQRFSIDQEKIKEKYAHMSDNEKSRYLVKLKEYGETTGIDFSPVISPINMGDF